MLVLLIIVKGKGLQNKNCYVSLHIKYIYIYFIYQFLYPQQIQKCGFGKYIHENIYLQI